MPTSGGKRYLQPTGSQGLIPRSALLVQLIIYLRMYLSFLGVPRGRGGTGLRILGSPGRRFLSPDFRLTPYMNICSQKELRMKPNPQRYIDLNHSGSNGAKAPPQSPNGYPGTEAPSWSLPGSGAEAFFGANPAPLPRADLAHLGAETALGLFCLLLEQRIFSEAF